MSTRVKAALTVALLCSLLLASGVLAMSSAGYRLDWLVPLTGGGGGSSSSARYAANVTVGQSVVGTASGATSRASLGYWPGIPAYRSHLPLVER